METRKENGYDHTTYMYWKNQIEAAETWRSDFNKQGDKIIARYRGEEDRHSGDSKYNILYANTETLAPVVYSTPPTAEVRSTNPKRIAARKGAEMIESGINYYVDNSSFDDVARMAVNDYLLAGTGQIRPKYNSLIDEDQDGEEVLEQVVFEEIDYEYVHWSDFLYPDAQTWKAVPWIAFKSLMTYDEATELFGSEKANQLKYAPQDTSYGKYKTKQQDAASSDKAEVYEIWDKGLKEQVFWADSLSSAPLEINDDPLDLENFYPVPQPLYSITTSGNLLPVPFFMMYQDQAIELDRINGRIFHMIENMRRRGFYDAAIKEIQNIGDMDDNEFHPITNWADFNSKGGLAGAMQVEDISTYANMLQVLEQSRQAILQDIYQIIGISDIRRAQTDPRETLGAQKLKSRYGTIRISPYQRKVAEFMRDLLQITGEIMIKQFSASTLAIIANMPLETKMKDILDENGQPTGEKEVDELGAIDLLQDLRDKEPVDIAVDIQTDSTIIDDEEADRASLTEAIGALSEFTAVASSMVQSIGLPATAKIGMEIIQRFKLGRAIQQDMQDHLDKLVENGLPEQASPEETLAQAELQKEQMRLQFETQKMQLEAQVDAANIQLKQQDQMLKARELGIMAEFNAEKINIEALNTAIKAKGMEIEARSTVNEVVGV